MIASTTQTQETTGYTGVDELSIDWDADPRWQAVPRD
jgi:hypothetical protein